MGEPKIAQLIETGFVREMTTRIGTITLRIPRHRNDEFSTTMFERYQRSEQALVLAMIEMGVNGVVTRKIEAITQKLCGNSFSKSTVPKLCQSLYPIVEAFRNRKQSKSYPFVIADVIYLKICEEGCVRSSALMIAFEVIEDGHWESARI